MALLESLTDGLYTLERPDLGRTPEEAKDSIDAARNLILEIVRRDPALSVAVVLACGSMEEGALDVNFQVGWSTRGSSKDGLNAVLFSAPRMFRNQPLRRRIKFAWAVLFGQTAGIVPKT